MERWRRRAKGKPDGWKIERVPMAIFREWLDSPGLEEILKEKRQRYGLPEDQSIIVVSGESDHGFYDIWMHPLAAFSFGAWYANKIGSNATLPAFGVIYAAIYDNGLTKVGMSNGWAEDRLAIHDSTMDLTGASPTEHIVMECKTNPLGVEARLIQFMAGRYQQKRREWFLGAEIEVVRQAMEDCIEEDLRERCHSGNFAV